MPVVDAVIVAILPDDGDGVRPGGFDSGYAGLRGIFELHRKNGGIRFGFHVLMPAPALGAWTGSPQQGKGVHAGVAVVPGDGHFQGRAVGSDIGGGGHVFSEH